jgi:predicted extracellular nuclease
MFNKSVRTPLIAAFFCVGILAACSVDQTASTHSYTRCSIQTTPIATIQGAEPQSSMIDEQLTVQGVVTLVQAGEGLYMEEPGSDNDNGTSNAIFVRMANLPAGIGPGSWISMQGTVTEIPRGRNTLTALTNVSDLKSCANGQNLPLTSVTLPLRGGGREAIESMRINIDGALTVTDTYQFGQGKFSLAGNGLQFVPTEVAAPGSGSTKHTQKNRNFSLTAMFADDMTRPALLAPGSDISNVTGVLAHGERNLQLVLQSVATGKSPTFELPTQAGEGEIRVVGMNLHNFFNGDGKGGDFPTPRGAKTTAEFEHQRQRLGAAIRALNPHVLAVMELENDGFGPLSAAADFIDLAQQVTGASWQVVRPTGDDIGSDAIMVGLFYRDDLLKTIGPARTLTGAEFRKSRQPLAQVFKQHDNDEKLLVVVNHLKSKGSCPDAGINANQKDGQGCWNPMRVASAKKMAAWVNSLSTTDQAENALILGDMNAYRREDPIDVIRNAGFVELMDKYQGSAYSFMYYGQAGTLDYAFVSRPLQQKVQRVFIWNVNAGFPAHMDLPEPWLRFSDHDPVVVDIDLRHSNTSD